MLRKNVIDIQLKLNNPKVKIDKLEGLTGYNSSLGNADLLMGKVILTTSKALSDSHTLSSTFSGKVEVKSSLLLLSAGKSLGKSAAKENKKSPGLVLNIW